jgi:hypothetical protein
MRWRCGPASAEPVRSADVGDGDSEPVHGASFRGPAGEIVRLGFEFGPDLSGPGTPVTIRLLDDDDIGFGRLVRLVGADDAEHIAAMYRLRAVS